MISLHGPSGRLMMAAMALLALWTAATPARAAGTIALKGSVVTSCGVQVDDLDANLNMTGGSTNLQVATVGEKCNSNKGYTVTISSANAGALVNRDGARAPYTASYGGVPNRSLATPLVLTRTKAEKNWVYAPFTVTLPANAQRVAGSYFDTITITIAAR
jgi:spore coat protein U-like protein